MSNINISKATIALIDSLKSTTGLTDWLAQAANIRL